MTKHALFPLLITFITYLFFSHLYQKSKKTWLNPLLFASISIMLILSFFKIPLEDYQEGTQILNLLIAPATVALAIPLYQHREYLRRIPKTLLFTTLFSSILHALIMFLSFKAFQLEETLAASLFPKSVTTAIAIEISQNLGGNANLTVAIVVMTGVIGSSLSASLNQIFHIQNPVSQGLALGSSAHAVGTAKASEMGEVQASMSALSLILTGIWTVLLSLFL